jgi:hypothetical protein
MTPLGAVRTVGGRWAGVVGLRRGHQMMALVSAPSNLGLRPPQPTSVPECAKAPEALREAGLFQRLAEFGAVDAGRGAARTLR